MILKENESDRRQGTFMYEDLVQYAFVLMRKTIFFYKVAVHQLFIFDMHDLDIVDGRLTGLLIPFRNELQIIFRHLFSTKKISYSNAVQPDTKNFTVKCYYSTVIWKKNPIVLEPMIRDNNYS